MEKINRSVGWMNKYLSASLYKSRVFYFIMCFIYRKYLRKALLL
jgi:hypothetical protein